MRRAWLLRGEDVLAAAEVADKAGERMRGLLGRKSYDGAMVLPRTRSVHTAFMTMTVDVAFVDADCKVLDTVQMRPWRMCRPRMRARGVIEASAGSFERWQLAVGDVLEVREVP